MVTVNGLAAKQRGCHRRKPDSNMRALVHRHVHYTTVARSRQECGQRLVANVETVGLRPPTLDDGQRSPDRAVPGRLYSPCCTLPLYVVTTSVVFRLYQATEVAATSVFIAGAEVCAQPHASPQPANVLTPTVQFVAENVDKRERVCYTRSGENRQRRIRDVMMPTSHRPLTTIHSPP